MRYLEQPQKTHGSRVDWCLLGAGGGGNGELFSDRYEVLVMQDERWVYNIMSKLSTLYPTLKQFVKRLDLMLNILTLFKGSKKERNCIEFQQYSAPLIYIIDSGSSGIYHW